MRTKVFVSSTCFDLAQVRRNLEESISKIGFEPLLSEKNNFPYNNKELVENCIDVISKNADVFLLIIGGRYGSKAESGKSITNIEYNTAKQLGIPIFVFIKKEVLNYLSCWEMNKEGNYSHLVDSTEIFEFINQIRKEDKVWSFEFDDAQDISQGFINQVSNKFAELLKMEKQILGNSYSSIWNHISSDAKQILLNQDDLFEFQFFRQTLSDELEELEFLKNHYDYNLLLTCNKRISEYDELMSLFNQKMKSAKNYIHTFEVLINELYPKYIGEPGVPSDLKGLLLVARSFKSLLTEMINWCLDIRSISVPDCAIEAMNLFSKYFEQSIESCWNFPILMESNLDEALERKRKGETKIIIKQTLELEIEDDLSNKLNSELEKITRLYNNNPDDFI